MRLHEEFSKKPIASFQEKVYEAVRRIPRGRVATYQVIAYALGMPAAARAVGNALNKNRSLQVPCHRVVRSDGRVGGFGFPGGTAEKTRRLAREGVEVRNGMIDCVRFGIRPRFSHHV